MVNGFGNYQPVIYEVVPLNIYAYHPICYKKHKKKSVHNKNHIINNSNNNKQEDVDGTYY